MSVEYTAQRIANTDNGWSVVNVETGRRTLVFCHVDTNTAEDAVQLFLESIENSSVDPAPLEESE